MSPHIDAMFVSDSVSIFCEMEKTMMLCLKRKQLNIGIRTKRNLFPDVFCDFTQINRGYTALRP
jgi:hypothetical protein